MARLPRLGLKGMEPHSALITFNKCKGSSRERNKGCSKEITRSAPRDGMYLSHLYLAWPRRKRAHGKKGQYRHTKKESFQKLRLPEGSGSGAESGLLLPSSHTWPLRLELKRTQARHEGFPGRSSGWPMPLGALLCHPLSLYFSWIPRGRVASYPPGSSVRLCDCHLPLYLTKEFSYNPIDTHFSISYRLS